MDFARIFFRKKKNAPTEPTIHDSETTRDAVETVLHCIAKMPVDSSIARLERRNEEIEEELSWQKQRSKEVRASKAQFEQRLETAKSNLSSSEQPGDIAHFEIQIRNLEDEVAYLKRGIEGIQVKNNARKLELKKNKKEINDLKIVQQKGGREVTTEQIDKLTKYLDRVKSVMSAWIDDKNCLVVLVRTAIRDHRDGLLYDMGDFELVLGIVGEEFKDPPKEGCMCRACSDKRKRMEPVELTLRERCVRLPYKEGGYPDNRGSAMYRLWFEGHQTPHHRENGEYYLDGGYFCYGTRRAALESAIKDGNVQAIFDIAIASLTNTQQDDEVRHWGALIPEDRIEQFYTVEATIN